MHSPLTLAEVPLVAPARVLFVAGSTLITGLLEIGFVEGEPVRVIAQGHPGREPIAVRVGGTTFALRRFEAEQVLVALEGASALAAPAAQAA